MTEYVSTIPTNASDGGDAILRNVIQERLGKSGYAPVVAAVTGLLARVAYADRRFDPSENDHIRRELRAMSDLGTEDVNVICDVLASHIDQIGMGPTSGFAQVLTQLLDEDTRVTMLSLLIEVAMADGHLFQLEVGMITRVANELMIDKVRAELLIDEAQKRMPDPG